MKKGRYGKIKTRKNPEMKYAKKYFKKQENNNFV